eukprot:5650230-Pyramimonas_sp.AAC.1
MITIAVCWNGKPQAIRARIAGLRANWMKRSTCIDRERGIFASIHTSLRRRAGLAARIEVPLPIFDPSE